MPQPKPQPAAQAEENSKNVEQTSKLANKLIVKAADKLVDKAADILEEGGVAAANAAGSAANDEIRSFDVEGGDGGGDGGSCDCCAECCGDCCGDCCNKILEQIFCALALICFPLLCLYGCYKQFINPDPPEEPEPPPPQVDTGLLNDHQLWMQQKQQNKQMTMVSAPQVQSMTRNNTKVLPILAATQLMQIQIPQGVSGGMMLDIQAPSGQLMRVQIPQGLSAGMTFQIQIQMPTAAPPQPDPKQKLIVRSSTTGKTWEYDLKESRQIYIGSDEDDSDILLDEDSEVSSDHAVLQWDLATSRLIFTDTDSTNGSKVNDNVAEANIQIDLNSDDNIQIGNTTLTIQLL